MKKTLYIIIGSVCVILCVVCVYLAFNPGFLDSRLFNPKYEIVDDPEPVSNPSQGSVQQPDVDEPDGNVTGSPDDSPEIDEPGPDDSEKVPDENKDPEVTEQTDEVGTDSNDSEPVEEPEVYVCPIDFKSIGNDHVYAWIKVPGTNIDYPVIQHPTDDGYYLRRNLKGKKDNNGTLFTEGTYNTKTFDDPVTVIYGHSMNSGEMFGRVQELFSDPDTFEDLSDIVIYTQFRKLEYKVFAAVPYDNRHILYNYDFTDSDHWYGFLTGIKSIKSFGANFNKEFYPQFGEKMLILSTCLKGDKTKRYLVLASLEKVVEAQ